MENDKKFLERVGEYIGKIVIVKYYDPNNKETKTERLAVSKITPSHIEMIMAYGDVLGIIGLAIPKIECIYSELNNDMIENPNYTPETGMKL